MSRAHSIPRARPRTSSPHAFRGVTRNPDRSHERKRLVIGAVAWAVVVVAVASLYFALAPLVRHLLR